MWHQLPWVWTCVSGMALLAGCQCGEAAPPPAAESALVDERASEAAINPQSEESLIRAFAEAIHRRELTRVKALAAPELAAELELNHDTSPPRFWERGASWVENVRSGISVSASEGDGTTRWRALITFGNGVQERVVFLRTAEGLRFDEL